MSYVLDSSFIMHCNLILFLFISLCKKLDAGNTGTVIVESFDER